MVPCLWSGTGSDRRMCIVEWWQSFDASAVRLKQSSMMWPYINTAAVLTFRVKVQLSCTLVSLRYGRFICHLQLSLTADIVHVTDVCLIIIVITCVLAVLNETSSSLMPNKFDTNFATPLEYAIALYRWSLGCVRLLIIFIWRWQLCTVWQYHSC